ncbi:MAG: hypothetical protein AAGN35_23950 [Bacteroidota bacterium]
MSSRMHRRDVHRARERRVRDTVRTHARLIEEIREETVYEKLPKPVFGGYRRFFVLRKDIAARREAATWQNILDLIQREDFSRRKDFKYRVWPSRRWIYLVHEPKTFAPHEFAQQVPFRLQEHFHFRYLTGRKKYYFLYPWMLVSQCKKFYYTHRAIPPWDKIRERDYLQDRILQGLYWQTYENLARGRYGYREWSRPRKEILLERYHKREMREWNDI